AAALPVLTVIAVMTIQFNKSDLDRTAGLSPEKVYDLSVRDVGSDQFAMVDVHSGETVTTVDPSRDGLVARAISGLERARSLRGLPLDAPYQIVIWDSGRLTLSDLETNRHIPLDSFGPTSTGALADLKRLKLVDGEIQQKG
ncbi:MAG: photosynthetic complex assembly protein PuhC, partial [Pseudomonadota bacterium]